MMLVHIEGSRGGQSIQYHQQNSLNFAISKIEMIISHSITRHTTLLQPLACTLEVPDINRAYYIVNKTVINA